MLSYESISDALLDNAEEVGLNVWQSDEQIDPHSLLRTFTLTCLPPGQTIPRPHGMQVTLRFRWDAAMTAISTIGTDALCKLYHAENVACAHEVTGCAYEAMLPLEIIYTLPVTLPPQEDTALLARTIRNVQDVHRSMIDHQHAITVTADAQVVGSELRVRQLKAQQVWPIGEQLHDLDTLDDLFEEICSEIRDLVVALSQHISGNLKIGEGDETLPILFDIDEDRVYLRPPVA